jgi:hypothetical protein
MGIIDTGVLSIDPKVTSGPEMNDEVGITLPLETPTPSLTDMP